MKKPKFKSPFPFLHLWGLENIESFHSLPSYEDQNFVLNLKIPFQDHFKLVLKIFGTDTSFEEVSLTASFLLHLQKKLPNKDFFPKLFPLKNQFSDPISQVLHIDPETSHVLMLLTFLPGKTMKLCPSMDLVFQLGQKMGEMDLSLQDFEHPNMHRKDFAWDLCQSLLCRPHLHFFQKRFPNEAIWLENIFSRFENQILPSLQKTSKGMIHNDCNENNLIVSEDYSKFIGIIDYGDICFSRMICNVAIALTYQLQLQPDENDFGSVFSSFLKGYESFFPLSIEEKALLPDLMQTRMAVSLVMCSKTISSLSSDDPDRTYIMCSEENNLRLLRFFQTKSSFDFLNSK